MRILITGITGMVGSHMADYIIKQHPEHDIHGVQEIDVREDKDRIPSSLT